MKKIDGKKVGDDILESVKRKAKSLSVKPCLAVILVGDDEASRIYVNLKKKASEKIGFDFEEFLFKANESEKNIIKKIKELNSDKRINGIIVQLPLPNNFDKEKIINTIDIGKDVDGFHRKNQNLFLESKKAIFPVFPRAIIRMINSVVKEISEEKKKRPMKATIVCKSNTFGLIMKKALEKCSIGSEIVFCDDLRTKRKNDNYARLMLECADIVITACGAQDLINGNMVKNDAIIIDGGIVKTANGVVGDVNIKSFAKTDCIISPVPGGVGPVTVATLLENVYLATKKQIGIK